MESSLGDYKKSVSSRYPWYTSLLASPPARRRRRTFTHAHKISNDRRSLEVDLTGDGDNALFLSTHQLLALSSTSNSLRVRGDAGDQLVADLTGAGFVDEGSDGTVTTYSNGVASIVVDDAVEAFVSVD